jgi:hypothetical protein
MAQMVECLFRKFEAPSSNPSTTTTKVTQMTPSCSVLGSVWVWTQVLHLLSKHHTTWVTPPAPETFQVSCWSWKSFSLLEWQSGSSSGVLPTKHEVLSSKPQYGRKKKSFGLWIRDAQPATWLTTIALINILKSCWKLGTGGSHL